MQRIDLGLNLMKKRTRDREFLAEMNRVVRWSALVELKLPLAPEGRRGRPPFPVETMLRTDFMQQWLTLSDPAMEETLHDMPVYREFANLSWNTRLADESTILRFRHLLEKHKLAGQILAANNELLRDKGLMLRAGTVVDATLIAAPSSTKNSNGDRDSEMHQSKKGNRWYFGMKARIGADAKSGLVHTVRGTAGNVNDTGEGVAWHLAVSPGKRAMLHKASKLGQLINQVERLKASVRAKAEHPFRVIKRQFGHVEVRYRGHKKNTAQLNTSFALANLWMVRKELAILKRQIPQQTVIAA